jgi:DNA topoisomerase-2
MKIRFLNSLTMGETDYHHGDSDTSAVTIIRMAQDFVGSNNINLLVPSGQFGARLGNGEDVAEPYYLFTNLSKIAGAIYHPDDDDKIFNYQHVEDFTPIEPEWFMPILPMVLINGADGGVGTDWSTSIPNYNPVDIVANLKRLI